ncbi:hypothetical protein PPERSA_03721 [Pseudocohnilembus persalinus]|uniref:Uncharacterized protein n=1 Tax=Pseudocohnilembus persalinus TaxID=266149 RepID=A0A0V0QHU8_PSEPJ|nr:hypothetical protein PPERSA_03721 [Pseudocohnilembus persalinus]|eukprot:KRX01637.1 hypothetical protein PPERSA_03721 [Pseudocohnilembus persalinus]
MNQNQILNNDSFLCKKQGHLNSPYIYLKFSENQNEILQCIYCNQQDSQNHKKIIIEQLLNEPAWNVKCFPPLQNTNDSEMIQKKLQFYQKDRVLKLKTDIVEEIKQIYTQFGRNIQKILDLSKKETIQKFENLSNFDDISELYDTSMIKQAIKYLQNNLITAQEFYEEQKYLKNIYENKKNINILNQQDIVYSQITSFVDNLKQQLNNKLEQFNQNIKIENINNDNQKRIFERQCMIKNIIQNEQQKGVYRNFSCDDNELGLIPPIDTVDKNRDDFKYNNLQNIITQLNQIQTRQSINNTQILKFYKQNNFYQDGIKILDYIPKNMQYQCFTSYSKNTNNQFTDNIMNPNQQMIIFDNNQINVQKIIYSNILNKYKTYHIKLKINLNNEKRQQIGFYLIDYNYKDTFNVKSNHIYMNKNFQGATNGEKEIKYQKLFFDFMNQNTTLNVVFNYNNKLFEIYDDNKQAYIKNVIDKNKIQGEMAFAINLQQNIREQVYISILSVSVN